MLTIHYITFSVSIVFLSWIASLMINGVFRKTRYYKSASYLNFVRSKKLNKYLGLGIIKWVVRNTPFKFFNPSLKLGNQASIDDLKALRREMTHAEISHLIGFCLLLPLVVINLVTGKILFSAIILIVNTLMNLYPSLLQQENKRRIDKLVKRYG